VGGGLSISVSWRTKNLSLKGGIGRKISKKKYKKRKKRAYNREKGLSHRKVLSEKNRSYY